ncbi:putative ribonuclease H-like domain-containing protein, partial [Tanacetum coccineum]
MVNEPVQECCILPLWSSHSSTIKSSEVKDGDKKSHKDNVLNPKQKLVDMEEQAFLEELERLKRQEKEANAAAEALRKKLDKICTASTPVSTASTPVSTASAFSTGEPSTDYDDSQIPALEDIYENQVNGFLQVHPMTMRIEPKKTSEALQDESWVDAMQEELLQFKLQKVWIFVELPNGKRVIGTKWVYKNKKDERGIVVRN